MPVVLLERLPLPSLKTYTSISVTLIACAVYYAHQVVTDLEERSENINKTEAGNVSDIANNTSNATDPREEEYLVAMANIVFQEAWCIWTLINMAYCCLVLFGKCIQKIVFGELRVSEQQHVRDKFWNFVFYKFIFIFGVMNVQNMDEVVAWSAWFSVLGFLHLLSQLCKDRFEYLSFSPTTPVAMHAKVLLLLFGIQCMCGCLFAVCFIVGVEAGINIFAFMIAECCLLTLKTLYVMIRYAIHLWDLHHEGVWENRAIYVYYSELILEMSCLTIDFAHHLHMLLWGNIFLSMASLVICMQLRYLFHEFQRRVKRHKNYLRVVNSMESRFSMASSEDIELNNDDCAICWDKMETARKLPCGHLFHNACLRSWLEQDTSCPTCRQSLSDPQEPDVNANTPPGATATTPGAPPGARPRTVNQTTNHFFHFDGSRYVSWLPSFSVEVTHTHLLGQVPPHAAVQTSQLDNMARQVQSVFPTMPLPTITEDLRVTRSVEMTIENILEGLLTVPPSIPGGGDATEGAVEGVVEGAEETSTTEAEASTSSSPPSEILLPAMEGGGDAAQSLPSPQLNFIKDHNIPDLSSEDSSEDSSPAQVVAVSSYRFSKSSAERESMLASRKESLLEMARRKYLAKKGENASNEIVTQTRHGLSYNSNSESCDSDDLQDEEDEEDEEDGEAFLSHLPPLPTSPSYHGFEDDDVVRRRELAFRAAQRRMQRH